MQGSMYMKKSTVAIVSAVAVTVIIFAVTFIISNIKDKNTETYDGTLAQSTKSDTAGGMATNDTQYISSSKITGYLMKSEEYKINIYEIYDNGHYNLIDTIPTNPSTLPEADRLELAGGIVTQSYMELVSLIEDYSS